MPVSLRKLTNDDADALAEAVAESVTEIAPWMVWCTAAYSKADALSWISGTIEGHREGRSHEFAVLDSDGTLAGCCGVNHINRVDRFANIGYWTRTSRSGRGIAAEAVTQLVSWAFANTELNRLEIVAAVGNVRSQRVAEKVGAAREGVLRCRMITRGGPQDAVVYSIVRGDVITAQPREP
jgi:RimJ/RimL family protein N-acetyltransferase